MADKNIGVVEINRVEHSDGLGVPAKRVFPWGFDGANLQPLSVDTGGGINLGSSSATIFAVVNTGNSNSNVTLNPSPNQIGSVTVSHPLTIAGFSGPTIYAVVNTGSSNANVTLNPSPNHIGSVTISHIVNSIATTTFGGNATVILGAGTAQIGSVTVANTLDIRSLNSTTTLFAVVNTGAVGNTNALATLLSGPNQIGSVTVSHPVTLGVGSATIGVVTANTNLLAGSAFIGLATVVNGAGTAQIGSVTVSNVVNSIVTIAPRTDYIGLASISGQIVNLAGTAQMGSVTVSNIINALATINIASAATIYAVVNTAAAGQASVVIDPQPILSATAQSALFVSTATGSMLNTSLMGRTGNVANVNALSALDMSMVSAATIYAVVNTSAVGNTNALATLLAGPNQIGSVTISHVVNSIVTVAPRTDYIGLVSVSGSVVNLAGTAQIGSVTVSSIGVGTATIGIVTANTNLLAGSAFVGLATVVNGAGTAQVGSVTVSNVVNSIVTIAPRTDYIGLASISGQVVNLAGTAQMGSVTVSNIVNALATVTETFLSSNYTSFATAISSTATLFLPPNGQRWVLKDLIIGSMGKSEVQISTHTTVRIPFISLATQGGYISNFGDSGLRGNVSGAFVITLNGTATVGISANVRFES